MKASKAIEKIIKKHGAIINLDEKPEIMIEILKGFGIKLKGESKPLAASLGSVVGKTLKVLGMKKKAAAKKGGSKTIVPKANAKKASRETAAKRSAPEKSVAPPSAPKKAASRKVAAKKAATPKNAAKKAATKS